MFTLRLSVQYRSDLTLLSKAVDGVPPYHDLSPVTCRRLMMSVLGH